MQKTSSQLRGIEGEQVSWSSQMNSLLLGAYELSGQGKLILSKNTFEAISKRYDKVLSRADREEPPPVQSVRGRSKQSKGRNLMYRMKRYKEWVLYFAKEEAVAFTNNLVERNIRIWKTKLKVSGSFRPIEGANHFARIKGFCSTAKKHSLSVYQELLNVLDGEYFLKKQNLTN